MATVRGGQLLYQASGQSKERCIYAHIVIPGANSRSRISTHLRTHPFTGRQFRTVRHTTTQCSQRLLSTYISSTHVTTGPHHARNACDAVVHGLSIPSPGRYVLHASSITIHVGSCAYFTHRTIHPGISGEFKYCFRSREHRYKAYEDDCALEYLVGSITTAFGSSATWNGSFGTSRGVHVLPISIP